MNPHAFVHATNSPDQAAQEKLTQEKLVPEKVVQEIAELAPWFHNLHLGCGVETAPDHPFGDFPAFKWAQIAPLLPADLKGWRALDIGCNAGFYSFALAQRGAHVLGIDVDPHYLRQARWAAQQLGLQDQVAFRQMQVYDLAHEAQTFDLVLFMGVFYHLRYPLLGLDIVCEKVKRQMVFQTLSIPGEEIYEPTYGLNLIDRDAMREIGWPKLAFVEHHLADDPTNWWVPNRAGIEAMLRSCGMKVTQSPGHEIYICAPDAARPSPVATWNRAELLSATGRTPNGQGTR
jgi:tRNA (mo5U34)-methyltransferase